MYIDNYRLRNEVQEHFSRKVNKLALNSFDGKGNHVNNFQSIPLKIHL